MEVDLGGHPGLLVRPARARALLVLAHGAGAGMRHVFMEGIAEALAEREIATLRWEFPYMAAGKKRVDAPAVAEAAVRAAWAASEGVADGLPRFAGGKSFGGRMTSRAHAAEALGGVRGIVFLGFPLHPPEKPGTERAEHLAAASGPLLFLQGSKDDMAPLRRLRPVVKKLGERATLHVVKGADHSLSGAKTRDALADALAAWMRMLW